MAPHHWRIANSSFELRGFRCIGPALHQPALIVGAGQGLIVAELRRRGTPCDGVDLSSEMIRYAKLRRGLTLIQADARAMPFGAGTYGTVIYATGLVDFMSDEDEIRAVMNEGRRIVDRAGNIFVAFYRLSAATQDLLVRLGLLGNNLLSHKESLEIYRLRPLQAVAWVAKRAKVGYARAAMMSFRSWALSTWQEKRNTVSMMRIFARGDRADALIAAAPEKQCYRNQAEIRNLFARLAIPIKRFHASGSCHIVEI